MKKIFFLLILLLYLPFVNSVEPGDYINEFNIEGEKCEIIDIFVYDISDPWIFNSEHKYTTIPVIYACCVNDSCTSIIFDINHQTFISDYYMKEIIDLNYVRYNLYNRNLSESYFEVNGLDLCSYFGFGDVKRQSLNLASEVIESGASMMNTKKAYQVSKTINNARRMGLIGKFNPASLIAGVGCDYDNKKLNIALENLFILNFYFKNIKEGYCQEGYISNLTDSVSLSERYLKEYIESPTAMARGVINWLLNVIKFLFDVSSSPQKEHEIAKTEYQIAQDTLRKIKSYDLHLSNPEKQEIISKNNARINLKASQFDKKYSYFIEKYNNISYIKPNFVEVIFIDLFYNPDYELREGKLCYKSLKETKELAERNYNNYRFNSAINLIDSTQKDLNCSEIVFLKESQIERKFDFTPLIIIIILILFIGIYIWFKTR